MKKHIPNLLTLGNLFCGTIATIAAVQQNYITAAIFVAIGVFLDFLDGLAARLLKVSGDLGKQLDSLADVVTSGVVPGIIMFGLLSNDEIIDVFHENWFGFEFRMIQLLGLLLTLGACYRLAKFNIDTRQNDSFIGLPTPAMSLFIISLPLIQEYSNFDMVKDLITNDYFLITITFLLTYLMNSEIHLLSLKFKDFSFRNNVVKLLFLISSVILIILLDYISIPIIIIFYIILSFLSDFSKKN
ncbi:MAG: Uncharacterised protein [Polaribacter sp. SA4-10]|nr:MAG: Uncharacterised protein [Polaribacter sp. SA4-10]|tara:strand:+ start:8884 stop:9612 length:729 start_codon:yes stop_codon:yes gene_type:complete